MRDLGGGREGILQLVPFSKFSYVHLFLVVCPKCVLEVIQESGVFLRLHSSKVWNRQE